MAKSITLEEIKEDMILAEPVLNKFGNILLPAGTTLNSSHYRLLKIWNVSSLKIINDNDSEEFENISEEQRSIAIKILNKKIRWKPRNEWEKDLIELGILTIAKSLTRKNNSVEV